LNFKVLVSKLFKTGIKILTLNKEMIYRSNLSSLSTPVVHVNHKQVVLDRIVECYYTNQRLRELVLKSGVVLRSYDSTHGMPAGYVYELEAEADFSDLLDTFARNGMWTMWGLDLKTKQRHWEELTSLHRLVRKEADAMALVFS